MGLMSLMSVGVGVGVTDVMVVIGDCHSGG